MKIMTQEDYKSSSGGYCPACQSEDIESLSAPVGEGEGGVSRSVLCNSCRASWTEFYYLAGYDALVDTDQNSLMKE